MTIIEAISRTDITIPNGFTQKEKIRWLSTIDATIKAEIIDTHEGGEDVTFGEYTEDVPLDTVLLAPAPYDEVYLRYLEMQIDYYNREFSKYNNSAEMYNAAYASLKNWYNQTHMPLGKKIKLF